MKGYFYVYRTNKRIVAFNIPDNAIESSASYFWYDKDGIINIFNKPSPKHSYEDAVENILVLDRVSDGTTYPLLIDMTSIHQMDRKAREVYAKAGAANKVNAVALVTKSRISSILANFFIGFNKPDVPTKLFNDHDEAKKWLLQYV